jgi:hypothetical protein
MPFYLRIFLVFLHGPEAMIIRCQGHELSSHSRVEVLLRHQIHGHSHREERRTCRAVQIAGRGVSCYAAPNCLEKCWDTFLNALIVQLKRWTSPTLEKEPIQQASHTQYTQSSNPCPNGNAWKDKSHLLK